MKNYQLISIALAFCIVISSAPLEILAGGWGIERGRADEGDIARLAVDKVAIARATKQIDGALTRAVAIERQKALLGMTEIEVQVSNARIAQINEEAEKWFIESVLEPAEAILENPAASCEEARRANTSLLGMVRQRALLGLGGDLQDRLFASFGKVATRCREEALDECIATGRFDQIAQTALATAKDDALIGGDGDASEWIESSLKQCARYELHFVSTTKAPQIFNLMMVRNAVIVIEFDGFPGKYNDVLQDFLKGVTKSPYPFFVSVKCSQPPLQVTCTPGANLHPYKARIIDLQMKHREFYVDANGVSRERAVGVDKLVFDLAEGSYGVEAVVNVPTSTGIMKVPAPMPGVGYSFYIAHKKDRSEKSGEGPTVKIERSSRGVYPELFSFIYADQDSMASDSTEFKLIHMPKPAKLPPRKPEPTRKPLVPRKPIGD